MIELTAMASKKTTENSKMPEINIFEIVERRAKKTAAITSGRLAVKFKYLLPRNLIINTSQIKKTVDNIERDSVAESSTRPAMAAATNISSMEK